MVGANRAEVAWVESMCVCISVSPHTMCFSSVQSGSRFVLLPCIFIRCYLTPGPT